MDEQPHPRQPAVAEASKGSPEPQIRGRDQNGHYAISAHKQAKAARSLKSVGRGPWTPSKGKAMKQEQQEPELTQNQVLAMSANNALDSVKRFYAEALSAAYNETRQSKQMVSMLSAQLQAVTERNNSLIAGVKTAIAESTGYDNLGERLESLLSRM